MDKNLQLCNNQLLMIQPFVILSFMINLLFTVFTAFVIYTNGHKQKRFILSMAHNIKVCSNHVEVLAFLKVKCLKILECQFRRAQMDLACSKRNSASDVMPVTLLKKMKKETDTVCFFLQEGPSHGCELRTASEEG